MTVWMLLVAGLALVGADQWMSSWVTGRFQVGETLALWQDVFHLTYIQNTGSAMGIIPDGNLMMMILTAAVLVLVVIYAISHKVRDRFMQICLTLILAGGTGNLIDRLRFGFVVDYFDFRLIGFWLFNIADCLVVVGTILLGWYMLFVEPKKSRLSPFAINPSEEAGENGECGAGQSVPAEQPGPNAEPSPDAAPDGRP